MKGLLIIFLGICFMSATCKKADDKGVNPGFYIDGYRTIH